MEERLRRPRLTIPVAPSVAVAAGLIVALGFVVMPSEMLDGLAEGSGIAAIIGAAEPPLNLNARLALALIGGGLTAVVTWFAMFLLLGTRSVAIGTVAADESAVPVLRREDAHPDAPARAPLFANRDLGTPFLDVHAPRALPDDLDEPLAAYDPRAFAAAHPDPAPLPRARAEAPPVTIDVPLAAPSVMAPPVAATEAVAAPAPLPLPTPALAPGERLETFPLTPLVRETTAPAPLKPVRDPEATIGALLERLERHLGDRAPAPAPSPEAIDATLGELRRLATRG